MTQKYLLNDLQEEEILEIIECIVSGALIILKERDTGRFQDATQKILERLLKNQVQISVPIERSLFIEAGKRAAIDMIRLQKNNKKIQDVIKNGREPLWVEDDYFCEFQSAMDAIAPNAEKILDPLEREIARMLFNGFPMKDIVKTLKMGNARYYRLLASLQEKLSSSMIHGEAK